MCLPRSVKEFCGHAAAARLLLLVLLAPCAMAQTPEQDRQREYYRELDRQREEQQRRAQEEMQRQQKSAEDASKRQQQLYDETTKSTEGYRQRAQAAPAAQINTDMRAARPTLLALPPLPDGRNVLLGRWRLEGGGPQRGVTEFALTGKGNMGLGDVMAFMSSMDSGKLLCDMSFGHGITFAPTTYSSGGAAGMAGGPIAYRSPNKQVIVAIPADSRANPMAFEIAGPDRIVWGNSCALVRVGSRAGAANSSLPVAAGAMPQVAAVAPTPRPASSARPSPEVCRQTLIDRIGSARVDDVRRAIGVRFKESIDGQVPGSANLRLDARGSACDDPRANATLYDFDVAGVLQSVTIVWARPAGPAPAPIFNERARLLATWFAQGPTQSTSRWQGTSTLARVTLQDMPERSLLLEAYAGPR